MVRLYIYICVCVCIYIYILTDIIDDLITCVKQISTESLLAALESPDSVENKKSTFVILVWVRHFDSFAVCNKANDLLDY
jgi:hypothetical protein